MGGRKEKGSFPAAKRGSPIISHHEETGSSIPKHMPPSGARMPPNATPTSSPTHRSSGDSEASGGKSEIDYVTLLAIAVLGAIACLAVVFGDADMAEKIVIGVVGVIGGFTTRSYLGR